MKYVSIDIETTGLNHNNCDILQFAAVIDDLSNPKPIEELPKFQTYFIQSIYIGEPFALSMHNEIFKKIANAERNKIEENEFGEKFMEIENLPIAFYNFLTKNGFKESSKSLKLYITVAGKNVAMFDIPFLKAKIKNWGYLSIRNRVIDPAILYYENGDEHLPDSKTCMQRAGIQEEVTHTALEDALMVIKLIRHKMVKN
jgi:oligoribonuclease